MFLQESGNIFLELVSSDTSSSVAACAAVFCSYMCGSFRIIFILRLCRHGSSYSEHFYSKTLSLMLRNC